MSYFNSQGVAIPEHLWRLGLAVRTLIEQYDVMDIWRRHVRGWVKHVRESADDLDNPGVVVMYLPQQMEIDEEYALLAAIHDNCASPERNEELIHPWAAEEDFTEPNKLTSESLDAIATYIFLMRHVLPEQGRRGIEQSKGDRLLTILRHVADDVRNAARLWTPDRSIYADEPRSDPADEYESFLRHADTDTGNGGSTTQAMQDDETAEENGQPSPDGMMTEAVNSYIRVKSMLCRVGIQPPALPEGQRHPDQVIAQVLRALDDAELLCDRAEAQSTVATSSLLAKPDVHAPSAVVDSIATAPVVPGSDTLQATKKPTPAERLAYFSYTFAEQKNERPLKDHDAHEWLKEHGTAEAGDELKDYDLPSLETWSRYLRTVRQIYGESKYERRADRPTGPSIVKASQI